ncbi:MAG: glycosyltransferase [Sulfuricurvum sp.]|nr:glycosyltransferase [Sulfuricurvum sp.]MDP3023110.1 glycosyltransferase [Sulfuricurvum sp.]
MKIENLAPVVLFVYNRLDHTKQTIDALQKNELSDETELYIYSDAVKNNKIDQYVKEVREYIKTIQGFKKVTIIEQKENLGLAKSIIAGVSDIINSHGKAIILEDDLVTSPYFLKYMNKALEEYKDEQQVWHISGWNYPTHFDTAEDTYFYRIMDCWGWATWSDRWNYFEKNTDDLIKSFTKSDIKRFNLDGFTDLWRQVKLNKSGRINTWAIYWYATIFRNKGLCLNPVKSFVRNIGHDGTGVHCNISGYVDNVTLNQNEHFTFPQVISENTEITNQIKIHFKKTKKSILIRIFNKLKTIIIKKFGRNQ